MSKVILGIDPGTHVTGYGLISLHDDGVKALDFGCIRPPKKTRTSKRYLIIYEAIEALVETYNPDEISVEGQFVHKNALSALKLGMARGMAILAAEKRDIPIFEYAPRRAKRAIVGHGAASKEQVQKMIQMLLNLPKVPEPMDAADALALALCHAHTLHLNL